MAGAEFKNPAEWSEWFSDAISTLDGERIGRCFIEKNFTNAFFSLVNKQEDDLPSMIVKGLDRRKTGANFDVVIETFFSALGNKRNNKTAKAVDSANECITLWLKIYEDCDFHSSLVPSVHHVAALANRMSHWADKQLVTEESFFQTKFVNLLRSKIPEIRGHQGNKTTGQIVLCNQLMKSMIMADNLQAVAQVLKSIDDQECESLLQSGIAKGPLVEFAYLSGKVSMWEGRHSEAEKKLSFAWHRCHKSHRQNQKLIVRALLVVRGNRGCLPPRGFLAEHGLPLHEELIAAIAKGYLKDCSRIQDELQDITLRDGTYLALDGLRKLAQKSLCRRVYTFHKEHESNTTGSPKVDVGLFTAAFKWQMDHPEFDDLEMISIISSLIYDGHIKACISHAHQKVVFSGVNPFPANVE